MRSSWMQSAGFEVKASLQMMFIFLKRKKVEDKKWATLISP